MAASDLPTRQATLVLLALVQQAWVTPRKEQRHPPWRLLGKKRSPFGLAALLAVTGTLVAFLLAAVLGIWRTRMWQMRQGGLDVNSSTDADDEQLQTLARYVAGSEEA